ncbi:MAG: dockerin type I domain-containing protein [Candidatus Zixiibacteriota bacterium]
MKRVIIAFVFLVFFLFTSSKIGASPVVVSGGSANDYESWIERLNDGRIMLVFCRNPDWASGDLYVTFSSDDGVSWAGPQAIITDAGDQATLSFVQLPGDTLKLFYASNETGSYGIHSAYSMDGITWVKEGKLNLGWSSSTTWYDPTVIVESDGSLTMSYVVSGSGVYIAHKPAGGSWDTDKTNVSTSGYRARVMKHSNGTYLYAYHMRTGTTSQYDVFITTSTDRGHWTAPVQLTTNKNSHDPFGGEMADGSFMVYYAKYESGSYKLYRRNSFDAVTWEPEEVVVSNPTNDTQPHFFCESDRLYLVWAHAVLYPDDHDVYFESFELPIEYLCGDTNGDTAVNIGDAVYLITYIFKGGPGPDPECVGDANGDGSTNIGDAVYLIQFIFSGGPSPVDDCCN